MSGDSENRRMERTPRKCFRCGSEDDLIAKCPSPHTDNEKQHNKVRSSERGNCALQKNATTAKY